jgi:hypothetical protein
MQFSNDRPHDVARKHWRPEMVRERNTLVPISTLQRIRIRDVTRAPSHNQSVRGPGQGLVQQPTSGVDLFLEKYGCHESEQPTSGVRSFLDHYGRQESERNKTVWSYTLRRPLLRRDVTRAPSHNQSVDGPTSQGPIPQSTPVVPASQLRGTNDSENGKPSGNDGDVVPLPPMIHDSTLVLVVPSTDISPEEKQEKIKKAKKNIVQKQILYTKKIPFYKLTTICEEDAAGCNIDDELAVPSRNQSVDGPTSQGPIQQSTSGVSLFLEKYGGQGLDQQPISGVRLFLDHYGRQESERNKTVSSNTLRRHRMRNVKHAPTHNICEEGATGSIIDDELAVERFADNDIDDEVYYDCQMYETTIESSKYVSMAPSTTDHEDLIHVTNKSEESVPDNEHVLAIDDSLCCNSNDNGSLSRTEAIINDMPMAPSTTDHENLIHVTNKSEESVPDNEHVLAIDDSLCCYSNNEDVNDFSMSQTEAIDDLPMISSTTDNEDTVEEAEEVPPFLSPPTQHVRRSRRLAIARTINEVQVPPMLRRSPRLALKPRVSYVGMC